MSEGKMRYGPLVRTGMLMGLRKGWSGFIWMMKIVLPISLLTALLEWSGWLRHMDFLLTPAMSLLHLPAAAALPLIVGMLANIYGGIAAMVLLPLTEGQMTLIGVFLLMAHNLIQEGMIQGRSGIHPLKVTLFRIATASLTVMIIGPWVAPDPIVPPPPPTPLAAGPVADSIAGPAAARSGIEGMGRRGPLDAPSPPATGNQTIPMTGRPVPGEDDPGSPTSRAGGIAAANASPALPLGDMLRQWLWTTAVLCGKIFLIIMGIMTLLETMKFLDWIKHIVRLFSPLLRVMGLDAQMGLLWMTAIVFGLAYGGAVIVEEAKAERLSKDELEILHLSIGINHSMVEDPPLFISLGLSPFWLYIPRLVVALATARLIRLWRRVRRSRSGR
ncbi:MAG: iron transporter [Pseudomonadota bacterium]|nr:iron transporter [Pseudomonadota bacterium]